MAGGFQNYNSKSKVFTQSNSNGEVIKDFPSNGFDSNDKGILQPGQTIEFSKKENNIKWSKEFLNQSINKEQNVLVQREGSKLQEEVQAIQKEIQNLTKETEGLSKEIIDISLGNIPENNQYQLTFLQRIKILIRNFRKNISQSQVWLETFNHKKNRRNAFWGKVRNKKGGGEQYLFSGEHSASRSAA